MTAVPHTVPKFLSNCRTLTLALILSACGPERPSGPSESPTSKIKVKPAKPTSSSESTAEADADRSTPESRVPNEGASPPPRKPFRDDSLRYVRVEVLNVRQGPGVEHPIVARVRRGTVLQTLGKSRQNEGRNWTRVTWPGRAPNPPAWVAAEYLSNRPPDTSEAPVSFQAMPAVAKSNYPRNPRRQVKGLYISIYTAASPRLEELLDLAAQSEINAFVIDVKDDRGQMLYHSAIAERLNPSANAAATIHDLPGLLNRLRDAEIYRIARIVVFKDPLYARAHPDHAITYARNGRLFEGRDQMHWTSPYNPAFRNYILDLAEEAAVAGFNEIQFDYIRFPVEPAKEPLNYPDKDSFTKAESIHRFLLAARERLSPRQVYLSADVFGLVSSSRDDMNIGQYWEAISHAVDFISPMMYPSHYANYSFGLRIPDKHPYELLYAAVKNAAHRNQALPHPAEIRPWIQGFSASWLPEFRHYGPPEIREQIRALRENKIESYLVWSPANHYPFQAFR